MTLTSEEVRTYVGRTVFDFDHEMVGAVDAIYFCDSTGVPVWLSFTTDFFAERDAFVPAAQITPFGQGLSIPLGLDLIRAMPRIKPRNGALSSAQVARLHEFFGTFSGQHFAFPRDGVRHRNSRAERAARRHPSGHREPRTLIRPDAEPSCPVFRQG
jgi:hypothetical protein